MIIEILDGLKDKELFNYVMDKLGRPKYIYVIDYDNEKVVKEKITNIDLEPAYENDLQVNTNKYWVVINNDRYRCDWFFNEKAAWQKLYTERLDAEKWNLECAKARLQKETIKIIKDINCATKNIIKFERLLNKLKLEVK